MWHVSICARKENGNPIITGGVSQFMIRQIRAFGLELLKGVGEGPTLFEAGDIAFHLRRVVNQVEQNALPKTWCEAVAVDEGGSDMRLIEWIHE